MRTAWPMLEQWKDRLQSHKLVVFSVAFVLILVLILFLFSCWGPFGYCTVFQDTQAVGGCVRYLEPIVQSHRGMGHRFAGILVAQHFAEDFGFVATVDKSYWNVGERDWDVPRGYEWFPKIFNMDALAMKNHRRSSLREVIVKNVQELLQLDASECNLLVRADTGGNFCEDEQYCFLSKPEIYSRFQYFWRELHKQSTGYLAVIEDFVSGQKGRLSVVWHVRNGDAILHEKDGYFENAFAMVDRETKKKGIKTEHYVTSERDPRELFGAFAEDPRMHYRYAMKDMYTDVLLHMKTDILVGCGSSFAYMTAMGISSHALFMTTPPKEQPTIGSPAYVAMKLHRSIDLLDNGAIADSWQQVRFDKFLQQRQGAHG